MNLKRNYAAEIAADLYAGAQPNMITVERAIAQADALRAEVARLREALQQITLLSSRPVDVSAEQLDRDLLEINTFARAALAQRG